MDAAALPVIEAKIIRAAANRVAMAGDKLKSFLKLIDLLEENDDVQKRLAQRGLRGTRGLVRLGRPCPSPRARDRRSSVG